MITKANIKKAMIMTFDPYAWLNCEAVEKQVAHTLEIYEDRDEFDGSFTSALECLNLAGYEVNLDEEEC